MVGLSVPPACGHTKPRFDANHNDNDDGKRDDGSRHFIHVAQTIHAVAVSRLGLTVPDFIDMGHVGRIGMALLVVALNILLGYIRCSSAKVPAVNNNDDNRFHHPDGNVAVVPVAQQSSRGSHITTNFTYWETSYGEVRAYLVVTNEAWSVVSPGSHNDDATSSFRTAYDGVVKNRLRRKKGQYNNDKSPKFATTAAQAEANNCNIVATNGGPYNRDGTSSGPLVMRGELQTSDRNNSNNTESSFVGFGITAKKKTDGQQYWTLGSYSQIIEKIVDMKLPPLWDFVTGFHWLVYDGTPVANNSANPTGAFQAARTVIGLDYDSNLFLLVVDGCEKWYAQAIDSKICFTGYTNCDPCLSQRFLALSYNQTV